MIFNLKTYTQKVYSDQITPISAYVNVRTRFARSILLESSENGDRHNSRSIICANPIARFVLKSTGLETSFGDIHFKKKLEEIESIQQELIKFCASFIIESSDEGVNGFFGFQSFEAVQFFESKKANLKMRAGESIALIDYSVYQYVICFNHFNNEITFNENSLPGEATTLSQFISTLLNKTGSTYRFQLTSEEKSTTTEQVFLERVEIAQQHCKRGDIFQLVLSRKFSRTFRGDELNVYRALRHINPSPYMFFFDYGSYKIFGSSPEAQIRISKNEASLNPIAGTYRKTGNLQKDTQRVLELMDDEKENAEHSMLVDLARNDLNRHCEDVLVAEYKTIKQFSHVIHMVSNVSGKLQHEINSINVMAATFPAGTLSGAPKIRAVQLIAEIEKEPRAYYGGSIGFIDFNGDINQAIIIRSFMTKGNEINYQAGAGVVLKSNPKSELEEINNKLKALRTALLQAEKF